MWWVLSDTVSAVLWWKSVIQTQRSSAIMSLLYPLPFSLRLKYVHILMNIRNDIDRQRQRRKIKICRSVTYQGTYHCLLSALIPVMSKIPDPWWIAFTHGSRNGPMHSHYGHPWVTLHIMPSAVGYLANSCPPPGSPPLLAYASLS